MSINTLCDYHAAGFRVFPLWGMEGGKCECGDPECQAVGKHPRISNWQHAPHWSEEQLDFLLDYQVSTGFGVCIDNQLVIDVDPRNGGMESYKRLKDALGIDFEKESGFVVQTGGGGLHIYFSRPEGAYAGKLDGYSGLDMKSSGFVVGAGSLHKSGLEYEVKKGAPDELTPCPQALLDMLHKKQHVRALFNGATVDITAEEVAELVSHIAKEHADDYATWVNVGMAIHHATNGDGYAIWDKWSQLSSKYDAGCMGFKWHSFGKSANPVTLGTLIYLAEQNGYVRPVTFPLDQKEAAHVFPAGELPFDTSIYDHKRPPGFVGKIAAWMNDNSYSEPLENLTAVSAIAAVGNIIGLHTTDDLTNVSTNLLVLCVAESASGKEMVAQSYGAIMRAAGMSAAIAGGIKSKQEICRNLIEHQAAFYLIDEMGEVLKTIENAKKRGGAAYLEGVTGEVMSIYTKASSSYQVTGDVRRELVVILNREREQCRAKIDDCEDPTGRFKRRMDALDQAIADIQTVGIQRPFLSMIGYSVPASMECIMSEEMAKNGFLSRALLAIEEKDNPKPRLNAMGMKPLPEPYVRTLKHLASTGSYDMTDDGCWRLEYLGERRRIQSTQDAKDLLQALRTWEWEYAEHHRQTSGFTPLIRRSFELISKISTILAAPEGLRTEEHVKWAAFYVKRDLDRKIRHIKDAISRQSKDGEVVKEGLESRIINLCQKDGGELLSVILNKCKRKDVSKETMEQLLEDMVDRGLLCKDVSEYNGKASIRYEALLD